MRRVCVCLLLASFACGPAEDPRDAAYPRATVTIGDDTLRALVAASAAQKRLGLGQRDSLPEDQGMLFFYPEVGRPGFWMRGMRFDIDILWIRDDRLVDLSRDLPHDVEPPLPTYRPRLPANVVLEVRAGTAAKRGWNVGDEVRIERD